MLLTVKFSSQWFCWDQSTCLQPRYFLLMSFLEHRAARLPVSLAPALKASRAPGTWPPRQSSYPLYPPHWPPIEGFLNKPSLEYLPDDFLWEPLRSCPRVAVPWDLLPLLCRDCLLCKGWTSWATDGSLPLPSRLLTYKRAKQNRMCSQRLHC